MAVPDFQTLMLPLLQVAADGREHSLGEARQTLAARLTLSPADQEELLPSGRQSKFTNRVAWAKVYLQQAGLLLSPKRGHFQVSDRGRAVLNDPPPRIDIKFLNRYPEFREFRDAEKRRERKGTAGGSRLGRIGDPRGSPRSGAFEDKFEFGHRSPDTSQVGLA